MSYPHYSDGQIVKAVQVAPSIRAAAINLGIPRSTLQYRYKRLQEKVKAEQARAEEPQSLEEQIHAVVPEGFFIKAKSVLTDAEGNLKLQWVKSSVDEEARKIALEAVFAAMADQLPRVAATPAPVASEGEDFMTVYPIGDPHIGMLSWEPETGESWDLDIAESTFTAAMNMLVKAAPSTDEAIVINLGDALHYDSLKPVTPRSGHFLDADGGYQKMVYTAVRIMRACIDAALKKHQRVRFISVPGNHDESAAFWLAVAMNAIYENEPRVTVDMNPSLFNYVRWGEVLLGVHHGHSCRPERLPMVMATDKAKDWGETTYRHWLIGHVHHESRKDFGGCSVESFGTIAAKDAYAVNGGWRAERAMQLIVYHKEFGEVARSRVKPAMFKQ